jgi:hypothetical protein
VNPSSSVATRSSWSGRLGIGAVGLGLLLGVFAFSAAQFGAVHGEEFAPHSFRRREFSFFEIPLVGIQVSPVKHLDTTGLLEDHLRDQKLVGTAPPSEQRWDLVVARRGQQLSSFGDAQILCNYLTTVDQEDDSVWLKWSEDHQESAKLLWPIVAKLAEQELYIFIPALLTIAAEEQDLTSLERRLHTNLTNQYRQLADSQRELGRHDRAIELYTESLAHAPDNAEAVKGRATSRRELGARDGRDR